MNPKEPKRILVFCSSAGEFEQARPLIDVLQKNYDVHVFFFSKSGVEFVKARNESISYSLTPIDTIWNWQKVFSKWQPDFSIVVRHELWPAFLDVASKKSRLILVNYSRTDVPSFFTRRLLKTFESVMCINQEAADTLSFLPSDVVHVTGDTKADRVFARARQKNDVALPDFYKSDKTRNLILGSAWEADVAIMAPAFQQFVKDAPSSWRLTICPHDISDESLKHLATQVSGFGLTPVLFSQISGEVDVTKVLIVDKLGILAELYSIAAAAFVGGGSHHKVHNVLEPAAYGCPLAFGPLYKNSSEACHFVDDHSATVVRSVGDGLTWLKSIELSDFSLRKRVLLAAEKLRGGTDRVLLLLFKI